MYLLIAAGYFDAEQLLIDSTATLARHLHVADVHAACIRQTVERATVPPSYSAWDLLQENVHAWDVPGTPHQDDVSPGCVSPVAWQDAPPARSEWLSSGVPAIDACIGGGFARGMVSELLGESSAGKTQLVLHTAVTTALGLQADASHNVVLGGSGYHVAIINTKGRSSARHMVERMVEIAREQLNTQQGPLEDRDIASALRILLRNVSIACALTYDEAEHVLCYTLPGLLARLREALTEAPPVELVVVDSVPPLLQEDSLELMHEGPRPSAAAGTGQYSVRAARLHALSEWLKRLAAGPRPLAVLVVNHVNDAFAYEAAILRQALAQGELPLNLEVQSETPLPVVQEHVLPVAYPLQAAHFLGLLACVPVAGTDTLPSRPFQVDGDAKLAQLGLVWTNGINARFLVSNMFDPLNERARQHTGIRRFRVVFSPTCSSIGNEMRFVVVRGGVHAIG